MMVDNRYRQQEAYVSTTHCVKIAQWLSASMAYDARWSTLSSDVYSCPEPYRWSHLVSMAVAVALKRFSAQASLLYNNTHDNGKRSATGVAPVGDNMKISRLTPALFLNCYITRNKALSVRGYVKNSFRMPTFNDLYYAEIGNSNLKPESATQYDLGVMYDKRLGKSLELSLQCDGYYNVVKDKIIAYPKGQQFRWTMLNLGKVHITGVDAEASARYAFSRALASSLRLQYTYQRAVDVTDVTSSYYEHQIPYIPKHSGSVIWSVDYKAFSFNYSFIYTGERYSQQENIAYNYLQPWYTSDISLSYKVKIKKCDIRTTLEINNLFSQDYDVILNYPMPKRNYGVTIEWGI
mgnify:CR=1 FL=1